MLTYEESYLEGATEISKRLTKAAGTLHAKKLTGIRSKNKDENKEKPILSLQKNSI